MLKKICGLTRPEDVELCLQLGFDCHGFIFHQPSPRAVSPEQVAALPKGRAARVGVFVNQTIDEIVQIMHRADLDLAQLHGDFSPEQCRDLGRDRVIKTFWPDRHTTEAELQRAIDPYAAVCRFYLFDAGRQGGGHGTGIHGLPMLQAIEPALPWFLAGGLSLETIPVLLESCRPSGLDVNSGAESRPGCKDPDLLRRLCRLELRPNAE